MENQTKFSKMKSNMFSETNFEKIKNLERDLKSRSEDKYKKYFKNFNISENNTNLTNNYRKFESLEEFKEKLKRDEQMKKLHNLMPKKPDINSITEVEKLNPSRSFYDKNLNNFNKSSKNKNDNFLSFSNKSNTNFFNMSNNNFFKAANYININNNFLSFNNSLKLENNDAITRNIKTAKLNFPINNSKKLPSFYNFKSTNRSTINGTITNSNQGNNINNANLNQNVPRIMIDGENNLSAGQKQDNQNNIENSIPIFEDKFPMGESKQNFFKEKSLETSNLDKEVDELANCHNAIKDSDLADENLKSFTQAELLKKFKLQNISDPNFEKKLIEYLQSHKNLLETSLMYNTVFKKFSSIERVYVNEVSHQNPITSYRKLKLNREIFENVMGFRQQKQIEKYLDIYEEENERAVKNMQMRKIKETDMKTMHINDDIGEVINPIDLLNEKHDSSGFNLNRQLSREQILNFNLEFFTSINNDFKIKPWARSNFTFTLDGNQIVMFGGISGEILYQVWICDLKNNLSWKQMRLNEDEAPNPRYGHTAVLFKKEVFIYGGYTPSDYFKPREEILIYNIAQNKFYIEKSRSIKETEWRRNHIAHTIGSIMVVHGGINDNGKTLNETIFLDFNTLKWNKLDTRGTRSPYLSSHCSEFVIENEKLYNQNYHIYKGSNVIENSNIIKKIEFEGIYLFGGLDEESNYKNDVYVLRVGRKPCEWIHLKINGNPPYPRVGAKMNFYQSFNILIMTGGRNDTLKRCIFNDIFVLDLENLNWIKPNTYPISPKERTGHSSTIYNNQLMILGGNNIKKFLSMDFFMLDLNLFSPKYRERERDKYLECKMKSIEKNKKTEDFNINKNAKNQNIENHVFIKDFDEDLKLQKGFLSETIKKSTIPSPINPVKISSIEKKASLINLNSMKI